MKTITLVILFTLVSVFSQATDWESYEIIDRLLTLGKPGSPVLFEDSVIFTASSELRKVGVAFAYENFSKVYWYSALLISQDPIGAPIPPGKKVPDPYKDSGIMFYVHRVPQNLRELEYRLVINGLWTADPTNPRTKRDPVSGLVWSVLSIPPKTRNPDPLEGQPDGLKFTFKGPPGEIVTVAGNFNGWDPFMYELKEWPAGVYSINIPLPSGRYQYVFFHRGERFTDPYNPRRIYSRDG
ncbi:MAG: glycogen-binding domain-containing protein, partial [Treponema sp.]|nr:glycogen-binding domain-containing protein [Treponema sp.]